MSLYFRKQNNSILVMGQTYQHRGVIKKLGGVFVPDRKIWRLPLSEEALAQVKELCGEVSPIGEESSLQEEVFLPDFPVVLTVPKKESTEVHGIKISELYGKVENVLRASFSGAFWLIAEVESIAFRSQGVYITLVEKMEDGTQLSVSALLWQSSFKELTQKYSKEVLEDLLQQGLSLCVLGRVGLYKGRGSLSFTVQDINPSYTKGLLALEREMTVKKLKTLGLYDANKKQMLLRFPFRIGLVTAEGSRAYSDFCHQLVDKKVPAHIVFAPAVMQGKGVLTSIKKAFEALTKAKCDMIVLTRGGGSASDLRAFDDFEVASLIASCKIPVIAAIGHHEDSPVVEEVCFQAMKTPTAAAEFILRHFEKGAFYLEELALQITKSLERAAQSNQKRYEICLLRLSESAKAYEVRVSTFLQEKRNKLYLEASKNLVKHEQKQKILVLGLENSSQKALFVCKEKLNTYISRMNHSVSDAMNFLGLLFESFQAKLLSYDPRPWLEKGWTQIYRKDGQIVKSVVDLSLSEKVEACFLDGKASFEVKEIKKIGQNSL